MAEPLQVEEVQQHALAVLASLTVMRRGWTMSKAMTDRVLRVQQVFGGAPEDGQFHPDAQAEAIKWAREVFLTRGTRHRNKNRSTT